MKGNDRLRDDAHLCAMSMQYIRLLFYFNPTLNPEILSFFPQCSPSVAKGFVLPLPVNISARFF